MGGVCGGSDRDAVPDCWPARGRRRCPACVGAGLRRRSAAARCSAAAATPSRRRRPHAHGRRADARGRDRRPPLSRPELLPRAARAGRRGAGAPLREAATTTTRPSSSGRRRSARRRANASYDLQGGLTLKIGVSGRVIAGPKGGAASRHRPAPDRRGEVPGSGARRRRPIRSTSTIPPQGSAAFTEVQEILVPSPGSDRDYIIYVGFDVGEWDPMTTRAERERSPPSRRRRRARGCRRPPQPAPAPAPPPSRDPKVLPTPTDGFVLPRSVQRVRRAD